MSEYDKQRLERAGFVLHGAAQGLREVLQRFPAEDRLARRLAALESEARGMAGEALMALRDAEAGFP